MNQRKTQLKRVLITDAVLLASAAAAYLLGPFLLRLLPPCGIHSLTGLYCAGCGGTRALHSLLRLDIVSALKNNLPVVLLMIFGAIGVIRYNLTVFTGPVKRADTKIGVLCIAFLAFMLIYMVLRNIPLPAFEILRPLS